MQHDVWTSKGNWHSFISSTVNYIDPYWKYVARHLTLKVVAWEHRGVWLAEPLANVLIKHNLAEKICIFFLFSFHYIFTQWSIDMKFSDFTCFARQPTQALTIKWWLRKCIGNFKPIMELSQITIEIQKPCMCSVSVTSLRLLLEQD